MGAHPAPSPPWQDLPPELLGLVLQCVPSHAGRVRFRAVCRPWRDSARMMQPALPQPLPWVLQRDGTFLSLPDGEVHRRVLIPGDTVTRGASVGSKLFLVHIDQGYSVIDPLSMHTAAQHIDLQGRVDNIRKVVVVSDHVTVVRAGFQMYYEIAFSFRLPHSFNLAWMPHGLHPYNCILDTALFQQKLYILIESCYGAHTPRIYHLHAMDIVGVEVAKMLMQS
ncbi:hypothetical protein QYE76_036415 [Lolium multiflorum]|uniref:F-box domain-containing protein n=1 Tax=Lolium multiflorum TaxID=4521 RepID=A0AAD8R1X7_LOLMU|nr:hypothetical protein QYE76_036415 [Lolium multiflorum]